MSVETPPIPRFIPEPGSPEYELCKKVFAHRHAYRVSFLNYGDARSEMQYIYVDELLIRYARAWRFDQPDAVQMISGQQQICKMVGALFVDAGLSLDEDAAAWESRPMRRWIRQEGRSNQLLFRESVGPNPLMSGR